MVKPKYAAIYMNTSIGNCAFDESFKIARKSFPVALWVGKIK